MMLCDCFFFQAEDGIRDVAVTGVQTCALPISRGHASSSIRQAGRRPQLYDLARPGPRGDSGVLSSEATTYDFADQRQNGIFARRGASLPLHAFETGICGLRG